MSEMMERVAQAIGTIMWTEDFPGTDARQRQKFAEAARAAIEAMREPTKTMEAAGDDCDGSTVYDQPATCVTHWQAMISAALSEGKS